MEVERKNTNKSGQVFTNSERRVRQQEGHWINAK